MDIRVQCLVIDAVDPAAQARFWAETLGWRVTFENEHESVVEPPAGSAEENVAPDLLFVRGTGAKSHKNRLHLDLRPIDQQAEVNRLVGLGHATSTSASRRPRRGSCSPTPKATSSVFSVL